MCVHTLLMLTYWSDKQHGASIAIINTCVYIHHWIRHIDLSYYIRHGVINAMRKTGVCIHH
jgi:hypothetical protein